MRSSPFSSSASRKLMAPSSARSRIVNHSASVVPGSIFIVPRHGGLARSPVLPRLGTFIKTQYNLRLRLRPRSWRGGFTVKDLLVEARRWRLPDDQKFVRGPTGHPNEFGWVLASGQPLLGRH